MPKITAPNQGCFKPGQSGNPAGRPKGSRHRATLAIEALLDGEGEPMRENLILTTARSVLKRLKIC